MRAGVAAVWLVLGIAPALQADFRQDYLDGLRALERGETEAAIAALGAAAAERPAEQARARLVGAIPQPYVPHHYLGIAYAQAGRCPEALLSFERSREHGVVATLAVLRGQAELWALRCAPPPSTPSETGRANTEPAPPIEAPATPVAPQPPVQASTAPAPAAPATPARGVEKARAEAWPRDVLGAAHAFLDGDYSGVLDQLGGAAATREVGEEARFARLLLRAAAEFALAALGEERWLAPARDDVGAARRLRPDYQPSIEFFSPRFVAFYRQTPP